MKATSVADTSAQANSRYMRTYLKPIMKSIYNQRRTNRLNGSFNGGIASSGMNLMDKSAK